MIDSVQETTDSRIERHRRKQLRQVIAIAAGLFAAVLLVLIVEGCSSVLFGRSLVRRALDPAARTFDGWDDKQRAKMASLTPGPFDLDCDPEVGHRVKAGSSYAWVGVAAQTDEFGMRVRPGGWPADDRPRWVVLGDSLAFGFGVADNETFAARLEQHVAAHWRGAGPAPAVMTVAAPGWNIEAAARFLRNHRHRYDPTLVVWIACDNDLESHFLPNAAGYRAYGFDHHHGFGRVALCGESYTDLRVAMTARARIDRVAEVAADGGILAVESAVTAGLAPLSRRRYAEAVRAILELHTELAQNDCRLAVVGTWNSLFFRELEERLNAAAPTLPFAVLLDEWRASDALVGDGHPNPACIEAGALRILQFLSITATAPIAASVPAPAEHYASRMLPPWPADERSAWLQKRRGLLEKYCGPRIDLRDGTGFQQIYGGVEADGTVGAAATFALRGNADSRSLALTIAPTASGLGPNDLKLSIVCEDGAGHVGPRSELVAVVWREGETAAEVTVHFPMPAKLRTDGWIDVRLEASNHLVETVGGRSRPASLRLISAAIVPQTQPLTDRAEPGSSEAPSKGQEGNRGQ